MTGEGSTVFSWKISSRASRPTLVVSLVAGVVLALFLDLAGAYVVVTNVLSFGPEQFSHGLYQKLVAVLGGALWCLMLSWLLIKGLNTLLAPGWRVHARRVGSSVRVCRTFFGRTVSEHTMLLKDIYAAELMTGGVRLAVGDRDIEILTSPMPLESRIELLRFLRQHLAVTPSPVGTPIAQRRQRRAASPVV